MKKRLDRKELKPPEPPPKRIIKDGFHLNKTLHGKRKFIKNLIKGFCTMNFKDICRGCYSKQNCTYYPRQFYGMGIDKCPCRNCLVKMTCNQPCEEYSSTHGGNVTK